MRRASPARGRLSPWFRPGGLASPFGVPAAQGAARPGVPPRPPRSGGPRGLFLAAVTGRLGS
eukprot:4203872-Lingulodinium_polyedra.AAC.1